MKISIKGRTTLLWNTVRGIKIDISFLWSDMTDSGIKLSNCIEVIHHKNVTFDWKKNYVLLYGIRLTPLEEKNNNLEKTLINKGNLDKQILHYKIVLFSFFVWVIFPAV